MSEKEEKAERSSRPSTGSSTEREETESQFRPSAADDAIRGVPDIDHEDIEKITSGHSLDVELQAVCCNLCIERNPQFA